MSETVRARAPAAQPKPDGKQRIYLYVDGEDRPALEYLSQYADDPPDADEITVRKVSEVKLSSLDDRHIVIPVVRDIDRDFKREAIIPSKYEGQPPQVKWIEDRAPVRECKAVKVADFYKRARGRDSQDEFREKEFIQAIGAVCSPAAPRVKRVGNNQDGHVNYLVLRWG
jgi:hypothetical protein